MWDPAGFLYVSDETINKIFRVYPDGKKDEVIALGDPDGNTFDRRHRLIDCASVLRAIIDQLPDKKLASFSSSIIGGCPAQGLVYFPECGLHCKIECNLDSIPEASRSAPQVQLMQEVFALGKAIVDNS